jgi:hypothetical protein
MIRVEYNRKENTTKVYTEDLSPIVSGGKIKVVLKNIVSGEIHYEVELGSYSWAHWCGAELITDVLFYSNNGTLFHTHKWDILRDGDEIEKSLWFYHSNRLQNGIHSNGLVIGSHDGRNGHWIYSILNGLSDATLIDGSEKQFQNLVKNYSNFKNLKFINEIVTVEGGSVTWYQGGEGYTDTVKKDIIQDWLDDSEITSKILESISFKKLIEENNFDWIHLDVEGIDGDLILSLTKLPNVIIYESMNLELEMTNKLMDFFKRNGYSVLECNGNTMATKNMLF